MNYSVEFKEAVDFSKENNLFLGYGNPKGKILMIGKEQYYKSKEKPDSDEFYKDLKLKRNEVNSININSWLKNVENNFNPNWDLLKQTDEINNNSQTIYWNQRNLQNRKLKSGEWNFGTSNTYLQYQKIYQNVFNESNKQDKIDFQKEFFLTELNDLLAEKDFKFAKLRELKKDFISQRQKLFNLRFFKSFPIIVIASGHYSRDFDFNIEKSFEVEWTKETILVGKSWINLHYSTNPENKRLLIHTRQLSTSVANELIDELSNIIKNFLQNLSK